MAAKSYVIVGSGVFGASTALYLIRKYPDATIHLIDRDAYDAPFRVAASWDWNKVIRADYADIFYTRLGLEAQQLWRTDRIWKPFYHESGVVWISPSAFGDSARRNFSELGAEVDIRLCTVDEAKTLYGGLFADADYSDVKEVLVNRSSGWAEAKEALESTIRAAVELGVRYVTAEVASLVFRDRDDTRECAGVRTVSGDVITGDKVVLCTGAFTPKLLVESDPNWTDLHAGDRIVAAGVTEAVALLGDNYHETLKDLPVGINDNPTERGHEVGYQPLPSLKAFKYWGQIIFRNTVEHPDTKEMISMPPTGANYSQWDVPAALQDDILWAPRSIFGQKKTSGELHKFRICWESTTPDRNFIISPHSACNRLFVATCGSFHGFKFLPVLGKYVVEMLDGELDLMSRSRWSWDRDMRMSTAKNPGWQPRRELSEFQT